MDKKTNWHDYKTILERNNIHTLYHFTDRENLKTIIKYGGLYSWKDCEERGIYIPKPGGGGLGSLSWDLDSKQGLEHYVRVSFTKQHPMMYVALKEGRISDCVILEINPEVIFWIGTKYADMNATRNGVNIGESIDDFNKIHFSTVKEVNQFVFLPDEQPYYQAEILVKNFIPLDYINNIGNYGLQLPQSIEISPKKTVYQNTPTPPPSPEKIVSALWKQGRYGEAISIAASGFVPVSNSEKIIENYIEKHIVGNNYQREININTRTFKYLPADGSSLTIVGNSSMYYVTVTNDIYKASYAYSEKDFERLLLQNNSPSELIKEIGFLCQQNYEERMSMGAMIQVLAHAEPMTEKFKQAVNAIMSEFLFLPDDFDTQICFFTTQQIEQILTNMTPEKKRFFFIIMSKLLVSAIETHQPGNAIKFAFSKRVLISSEIVKRYNLPQK